MKVRIKNSDFKKCLNFLEKNPNWLGDYSSKDANGRYINYIELLEVVWACVREKEIGVE